MCTRIENSELESLKAGVIYRIYREGYAADISYKIYHYTDLLGGVRIRDGKVYHILGLIQSHSDAKALSTVWKHWGVPKKVVFRDGKAEIVSADPGPDGGA